MATFEISAQFLSPDEQDVLDKYRIKDVGYGVKMTVEGRNKIKFHWSPIQQSLFG